MVALRVVVPAAAAKDIVTPFVLLDESTQPRVVIAWEDGASERHELALRLPYGSDAQRTAIAPNLDAFVAAGGTRLSKGAGHPRGAVVRVGFYARDNNRPLFEGVTPDTIIEVRLEGVRFNQPVHALASSVIQHLKYDPAALESCGMPPDAREQFNIASPVDTLNDRVRPGIDARLGAFGDHGASLGDVRIEREADDTLTLVTRFAYPALRSLRDPWRQAIPGTFLEPVHFHLEFEALPMGVEPLDPARERLPGVEPVPLVVVADDPSVTAVARARETGPPPERNAWVLTLMLAAGALAGAVTLALRIRG